MTVTVTKREAQAMIDQARNRIIERMLDRYDVQGAVDNARDRIIAAFYDLEQQRTRINAVQHEQTSRRLTTMDNRMRALEAEITVLTQMLSQSLNRQTQIADQTRRLTSNGNDSIAILQRALQQ